MKYLWIGCDGSGSNPPAISICLQLMKQGHSVHFVGIGSQRSFMSEDRIPFSILPDTDFKSDSVEVMQLYMKYVIMNSNHYIDTSNLLKEHQPDILIVDCMMAGLVSGIEKLKDEIKCPVHIYIHSTVAGFDEGVGAFFPASAISGMRSSIGLPPISSWSDMWYKSGAKAFVVSSEILENEGIVDKNKSWVRYIGPQIPPSNAAIHVEQSAENERINWKNKVPWPLNREDDPFNRPLILVSFSTLKLGFDQYTRIERTLQALTDSNKYRVICTSSRTNMREFIPSKDILLTPYIPHSELFPFVNLCVTHGGHSTFSAALLHGIPMVLMPNIADQPILSARAEQLNVGIKLNGETATPDDIKVAVDTILNDPTYYQNGKKIESRIKHDIEVNQPLKF